jgi:hypothetical protein
MGSTGARPAIFAMRPTFAVNYLDSGTTGADYIDYAIADRTVSQVSSNPITARSSASPVFGQRLERPL